MTSPSIRSNLGNRQATGKLLVSNRVVPGAWVVTFDPADMPSDADYEVWHGAIRGPGGYFLVYLDDALYGVGQNGLINEYAPTIPMYVRKGQTISLHWSIATGSAPLAYFYLRIPEVGRL